MNSINVTMNLNKSREALQGKILSRKDMELVIYGAGFPKHSSMFKHCLDFKVFNTLGPNQYAFGTKPIFNGKVMNAYNAFQNQMKNYRK